MPIEFQLDNRLAGFAAGPAQGGQQVRVLVRELVSPNDTSLLLERLEKTQGSLFARIPGAPPPSLMDHILVVIRPDLSAIAHVNELQITAQAEINRGVKAGEPILVRDVERITSVDLGVEIPDDCAVVLLRSNGWRRSLFYDYGPLGDGGPRNYRLDEVLAQQSMLLIGLLPGTGDVQEHAGIFRGLIEIFTGGLPQSHTGY